MFIQHLGLTKSYKESLNLSSQEPFLIFFLKRQEIMLKRVALAISELPKRRKGFIVQTRHGSVGN